MATSNTKTWLLEVSCLDASDVPQTLRFSSAPYSSSYGYSNRIQDPGLYATAAFGLSFIAQTGGGFGKVVLANADGGLNYVADYAVDGRAAVLSLVNANGTITTVLSATCQRFEFDGNRVNVVLIDPRKKVEQAHPQNLYAGTNSLPNGLEGVATDLQGKPKPKAYGKVRSASPVLVNTSRLIYQVHDGSGVSITAVYDRGVLLTAGSVYSSQSDMETNAPSSGQYRTWGGYFRLGSRPVGDLTADADAAIAGLGSVFAAVAAEAGYSVDANDVAAGDFVGEAGLNLVDKTNTSDLLDKLALSGGGYWFFDSSGIRLRQLGENAAGGNVVLNPGFESNVGGLTLDVDKTTGALTDNWSIGESGAPLSQVVARISSAAGQFRSGLRGLAFNIPGGTTLAVGASEYFIGAWNSASIPVTPGDVFYASAWFSTQAFTSLPGGLAYRIFVGLRIFNSSNAYVTNLELSDNTLHGYTRRTAALTIPAGGAFAVPVAYTVISNSSGSPITIGTAGSPAATFAADDIFIKRIPSSGDLVTAGASYLRSNVPAITLTDSQIVSITRRSTGAGASGLPIYRTTLQADRVEKVQNDLAASAGADYVARAAAQYRQAVYTDSVVKNRYLLADELNIESCLRSLTDAQTQATRLGALLAVRRDLVDADVYLSQTAMQLLAIGGDVGIVTKRLGYATGRNFVVLGYELDARRQRATLNLWG